MKNDEVIEEVATHVRLWLVAVLAMAVDKSFFGGTHGFFDFLGSVYLYLLGSIVIGNSIRRVIH